jgi:hypothetical protein
MRENSAAANQGCAFDHGLWLTMRAAYDRYQRSLVAVDTLTAISPSPERDLRIEAAAAEQRAAFEDYIESRLALTESMISPWDSPTSEPENSSPYFGIPRTVLVAVAACLLPLAFGLGNLVSNRRQVREIEAVRQEANAKLAQMRSQIEALSRTAAELKTEQQASVRNAEIVAAGASRPGRASQTPRRSPRSGGKVARNHQEVRQLQKRGDRNYYEFLFTASNRTERFGRVRLTILDAVPGRHFSDLSIAVDNRMPNRKRVNLYEPVWIDLAGHPRAVELVVNRIDKNRVAGYLSEPKSRRLSWRGASPQTGVCAGECIGG